VVAVKLTHNSDHPVDSLQVAAVHFGVSDKQRLAEPAHLKLEEFLRREPATLRKTLGDQLADAPSRQLFDGGDFADRHARGQTLDDAQLPKGHLPRS
jgi:hypothetical protein